jgi:TPR repeat protein
MKRQQVVVPSRKFRLAAFAARHGDAQGLFVLGCCFEQGVQCSPSLDQAGQCYHEAAKLDWVEAQHRFAVLVLQHGVPERARWLARAARLAHVGGEGFARAFLDELAYAAGYAAPNREMRKLLAGRVRGRHVFGIEATERELEVVSSFLGNKENSGVEEQRLRLELAKERAEKMVLANELESARQKAERCDAARLLSETRVACAQKEMESALQRADELSGKLSELRSAANQLLISLNQSKHTSEPALQNCMQYVHLSKRGVWSTRTLPLPEACLSLLEVFELTPDHPAAGVGGARGVRVRLDAERALKMGETVMYYGGHVRCGLHDGQCDPSDYPCPLNLEQQKSTDPVVDAMYLGSLARFLNDARGGARESNCQTQFDTVRIGGSLVVCVAIRTLRVIHAGEELLIDYGDAYWAAKELRDGPQERAISDLRNKLLHY